MPTELVQSIVRFYDRFLQYSMAGLFGTATHWILFSLLIRYNKEQVVSASAMGFICGAAVNYFLNYYVTFHSNKKHSESACKFGVVALLLFGVNVSLMYLFINFSLVPPLPSQILSSAVVLPIGYILNKHLTF